MEPLPHAEPTDEGTARCAFYAAPYIFCVVIQLARALVRSLARSLVCSFVRFKKNKTKKEYA